MSKLFFATSNKWKFSQAKTYLSQNGITLEQADMDLFESRSEEGEVISKEKADMAFAKLKAPVFVIDGSLEIKALNNFPKTYVKFAYNYIKEEGVIKLMSGIKDRRYEFKNYLHYKDGKVDKVFVKQLPGIVANDVRPALRSAIGKFDRILIPSGYDMAFSEMSEQELEEHDNKYLKPAMFDGLIEFLKSWV